MGLVPSLARSVKIKHVLDPEAKISIAKAHTFYMSPIDKREPAKNKVDWRVQGMRIQTKGVS